MNQQLYDHLAGLGFTQAALDDRIRAYLRATVVGATGAETTNDLWMMLGAQLAFTATTIQEVQMAWCLAEGSTGTTWNDLMSNLP